MVSLSALPTEILNRIAKHLIKADLGFEDDGISNLRLTCRATCLKTQYEFGRAAFSTLRLDLHSKTLYRLLTIASCQAFGEAVKRVIFAHWGDEYVSFPAVDRDGEAEFSCLENQVKHVLRTVFKDAFGGMPNLKEVVIVTPYVARFQRQHSTSGTNSNLETTKSSKKVVGDYPSSQESFSVEQYSVSTDLLCAFITEAAFSTGIRLSNFEITGDSASGIIPGYEFRTVFSMLDDTLATSLPALSNVERLSLNICTRPSESSDTSVEAKYFARCGPFCNILNSMQKLSSLELRFNEQRSPVIPISTVEAMGTSSSINLPRLTTLSITNASIPEDALTALLSNHKATLRHLGLRYIQIYPAGTWGPILTLLINGMPILSETHLIAMREVGRSVYTLDEGRMQQYFSLVGRDTMIRGLKAILANMMTRPA